jgi:hypothetical protein
MRKEYMSILRAVESNEPRRKMFLSSRGRKLEDGG